MVVSIGQWGEYIFVSLEPGYCTKLYYDWDENANPFLRCISFSHMYVLRVSGTLGMKPEKNFYGLAEDLLLIWGRWQGLQQDVF